MCRMHHSCVYVSKCDCVLVDIETRSVKVRRKQEFVPQEWRTNLLCIREKRIEMGAAARSYWAFETS